MPGIFFMNPVEAISSDMILCEVETVQVRSAADLSQTICMGAS